MTTKGKLNDVIGWLNREYNQESPKYSISDGPKPEVIRYDEETAISLWACGAIVCIGDQIYFIDEDDGFWFTTDTEHNYALQGSFCIGWLDSYTEALRRLNNYVKDNGSPVYYSDYYSDTGRICHYELKGKQHLMTN